LSEALGRVHVAALDGVRGIAVLLVLLFHFLPDIAMQSKIAEWFKKAFTTGGWIGVDLFFVLSGFLITSILVQSKGSANYFTAFYVRRALRIFPLYYGALILIFLVLPLFGVLDDANFEPYREIQAYYWLYLSNVSRWFVNEDALSALQSPISFGHLWSLAVEEHFYLAWPAVVLILSIGTLRIVCCALLISALLLRCLAAFVLSDNGMHPFLLTPLRWDALAAGALVATWYVSGGISGLQRLGHWPGVVISTGSATLILLFYLLKGLWPDHWAVRSIGLSIVAVLCAAFLIKILLSQDRFIGKVAASKLLRFFGTYSYGLYLIHGFLRPTLDNLLPVGPWLNFFSFAPLLGLFAVALTKIGICTVLAVCSWHGFEYPILKLKRYFPYLQSTKG
jgi:peptidoglycan/LPS O-acetylase OafA/YrhL